MYRKEITAEFVVEFLNNLLKIDKDAIMNLIENRVRCNDAIGNHEEVQASFNSGRLSLGLLGLINGFFGVNDKGYGCIVAHYDGDESKLGDLLYFSVKRDW